MTIEEMKVIEPRLQEVENYAKKMNSKENYWVNVWSRCKYMQYELVGWGSDNLQLNNSKCFDLWYKHLYKLTPKCK